MDREQQRSHLGSFAPEEEDAAAGEMVDYMLGQPPPPPPTTPGPQSQVSFDKLTFSDVLQFADFGPKLALNNHPAASENGADDDDDDDESYFLRFQSLPCLPTVPPPRGEHHAVEEQEGSKQTTVVDAGGVSESTTLVQQADGGGGGGGGRAEKASEQATKSGRRKRPRTIKTTEEVESQRMTHIAVERNRRRQMNEYLRLLRSLMPGSYVQRGDQASIIGGAIEFIRELEQLIQCLESQKRRRLYGGDAPRPVAADGAVLPAPMQQPQTQPQPPATPFFSPSLSFPASSGGGGSGDGKIVLDLDAGGGGGEVVVGGGLREDMAENKSCLADIEVRVLGVDAMIKILSRRRPGQLIKTVAALEDMHMSILHTNITTIDQTVLYSFNVKVAGEARFSAEDIAGAVHQILSFIDVNYAL